LLLVELLDTVLDTVKWEVIFVDDDSPDGTAELIREISQRDPRVRCLQRIGRRGTYDRLHRGRPGGLLTLISP
jgi:dolichol-phosphate mannosyltransferase